MHQLRSAGGHDWLDYIGAIGGAAGIVLSAVALVIAIRSALEAKAAAAAAIRTADAADRTARAAESTANIMAAEHEAWERERSRRPEFHAALELTHTVVSNAEGNVQPYAVVEVGIRNAGDMDADSTLLNLLVPTSVQVKRVHDRHGNGGLAAALLETREPFVVDHPPDLDWLYPNHRENIEAHISIVNYYRLVFPGPGRYPLKLKVIHHRAPNSGSVVLALIEVTDATIAFVDLDDAPEAAGLREALDELVADGDGP